MAFKTFAHGIHPEYHKEATAHKGIEKAPIPSKVIIPLQQHIGKPCKALVKKGEEVVCGQKIGDVEAFISSPVHASVTGKVLSVEPYPHPLGGKVEAVVIQRTGEEEEGPQGNPGPPDLDSLTPEEIRKRVREAGIVGMGGATFPTHVKLSPPENKRIDTVIINGCECEPYLTADHRLMVEEGEGVLWGALAIKKAVGAERIYIGVEENKMDALTILKQKASAFSGIEVVALETKYPQGAEKMLIKAILDRDVPVGGLPMDVGVVVQNVGTAFAIYRALKEERPLIERVVTVTGSGIREPKNLLVRIGTPFRDVIEACGGMKEGRKKVIMGGPMMGIAQMDLDVPVIKGTTGIVVFGEEEIELDGYEPCIRCASCVEACPMNLMPLKIGDFGRLHMVEEFKAYGGMACIECGCCSFVCPSKRPLVHWIRIGKIRVREAERKVGGS